MSKRPPKRAAILPNDRPLLRLTTADREKVMQSVDTFIAWARAKKGMQAPTQGASRETYPLARIVESSPVLSSQEGQ